MAMMMFAASPLFAADGPCGRDAPCFVEGGEYYLAFPDDWDGVSALPAIMFYHGHNSSGLSPLRSKGLRESFLDSGYLLFSPTALRGQMAYVRGLRDLGTAGAGMMWPFRWRCWTAQQRKRRSNPAG